MMCRSWQFASHNRLSVIRFGAFPWETVAQMALLTARVAAERLGVGYSTLKRWVRNGRVRTTRTEGGHHRVAEAEIDRLLAPHQPSARKRLTRTDDDESLGGLSARNRLFGYIEEVRVDG